MIKQREGKDKKEREERLEFDWMQIDDENDDDMLK